MSTQHLEELLLPITILRLDSIYPHWTSKAFHGPGLVELRLNPFNKSLVIHESQLVTILADSPQLHVLELGIHIDFADTPLAPTALHNLK
ncbi:hypothetical protein FRC11_012492, partial [Ceratobasidium sp. 423]